MKGINKECNKIENILKILLIFNNCWGITKHNGMMSCYTDYQYKQSGFIWGDRGQREKERDFNPTLGGLFFSLQGTESGFSDTSQQTGHII